MFCIKPDNTIPTILIDFPTWLFKTFQMQFQENRIETSQKLVFWMSPI